MSWEFDVASSVVGLVAASVGVALTAYKGSQYQSYLPKKAVNESLESLNEQADRAQYELDRKRKDLASAELTIQKAESLRSEIEVMRKEASELQAARVELGTLTAQVRVVREQIEALDHAKIRLQGDINERTRELQDLNIEVESQKRQILPEGQRRELEELSRQLSSQVAGKTQQLSTLEEQLKRQEDLLDASEEEHANMNKQLDALEGRKLALHGVLEGLEAREKDLRASIDDLIGLRNNLQGRAEGQGGAMTRLLLTPALRLEEFSAPRSPAASESDLVEAALASIRGDGLIYPERTILAFHTALKCAEDSPLVVLAGLSGTGKSALPRAYARAMGMHQLTVAVQPGWDSPSDLLGFYNHLERQFKPTELTRALVQMGPQHAESDGSRVDLSQRMLLVLLDEMNLARVEYYFSEFLSRLEARRGVQLNQRDRLRDAIVPLELGVGPDGAPVTYPLLVWKNVLFVGTMNEDESTQTLSDKVIDRSNLLRFGKPSKLHVGGSPVLQSERSEKNYLKFSTWDGWCVPKEAKFAFEDKLQQLNGHLETVGRSFGHRVATGMRRYVDLYPRQVEHAQSWAFADQIEFRILPRLRGLDLSDPAVENLFQHLEDLCGNTLEDRSLAKAIKSHREQGDQAGQFHWRGLDRMEEEA